MLLADADSKSESIHDRIGGKNIKSLFCSNGTDFCAFSNWETHLFSENIAENNNKSHTCFMIKHDVLMSFFIYSSSHVEVNPKRFVSVAPHGQRFWHWENFERGPSTFVTRKVIRELLVIKI